MNRRTRPYPAGGHYGGRQRSSRRPLVLALILGAIVIAAVFLIFRLCSSGCSDFYCSSDVSVSVPEGYELVTDVYEREGAADGQAREVSLPLNDPSDDNRNLNFFAFDSENTSWTPVAPAVLSDNGANATGTIPDPPAVLAVMRRLSAAGHVVAYLAHNQPLHADAVPHVTVVHTRDFAPASDGSIAGEPSDPATLGLPADRSVALYPSI